MATDTLTKTRPATAAHPLAALNRAATSAWRRWSEQSRIRAELRSMTARELADLGINPSDIDDVARGTFRRA